MLDALLLVKLNASEFRIQAGIVVNYWKNKCFDAKISYDKQLFEKTCGFEHYGLGRNRIVR